MENEMIIMRKVDFTELIEQLKLFNENFEKMNFNKKEEKFLTRKEVEKQYKLSIRAVRKIFTVLLKDKVVNISKEQRLSTKHIDDLFNNGVVLKDI